MLSIRVVQATRLRAMARRPFRGLRDRPPRERYDAVVIGAGVGGLFCANLLAKEGLSVLLVEQHYMVGGFCSTFRRGGFTFDAATHFYPLLGNRETLPGRILVELGVTEGAVQLDAALPARRRQRSWSIAVPRASPASSAPRAPSSL